jgi:hypothetical protein
LCQFILKVYRRSVEKQKQAKIIIYCSIILWEMETILQIRIFIHFSVEDKAKRTLKSNLAYESFLNTTTIISPSARTEIQSVSIYLRGPNVDISWLDWAYKSSTFDAIYIMVVKFRNTIWPPPTQLSLHRRAAQASNLNGTWSYIAERTQNTVYIVSCLWVQCWPVLCPHLMTQKLRVTLS